jgi:hypothetical protein
VVQTGQSFQVLQPSIRDLRAAEAEPRQTGQVFQMLQPGVRDLRVVEDVYAFSNSLIRTIFSMSLSSENANLK